DRGQALGCEFEVSGVVAGEVVGVGFCWVIFVGRVGGGHGCLLTDSHLSCSKSKPHGCTGEGVRRAGGGVGGVGA
ncbi:hypothetical protein HMPREF3214_01715, partial [Alloscardovia omnicolens]